MTFKKKAIIVLITGICAAMLGGCRQYTTKSGHALDKNKVLQAVRLECPTEQIELVSEDISNTLPEEVTYHFRSTKRDLVFAADLFSPFPSDIDPKKPPINNVRPC